MWGLLEEVKSSACLRIAGTGAESGGGRGRKLNSAGASVSCRVGVLMGNTDVLGSWVAEWTQEMGKEMAWALEMPDSATMSRSC